MTFITLPFSIVSLYNGDISWNVNCRLTLEGKCSGDVFTSLGSRFVTVKETDSGIEVSLSFEIALDRTVYMPQIKLISKTFEWIKQYLKRNVHVRLEQEVNGTLIFLNVGSCYVNAIQPGDLTGSDRTIIFTLDYNGGSMQEVTPLINPDFLLGVHNQSAQALSWTSTDLGTSHGEVNKWTRVFIIEENKYAMLARGTANIGVLYTQFYSTEMAEENDIVVVNVKVQLVEQASLLSDAASVSIIDPDLVQNIQLTLNQSPAPVYGAKQIFGLNRSTQTEFDLSIAAPLLKKTASFSPSYLLGIQQKQKLSGTSPYEFLIKSVSLDVIKYQN